MPMMQWESQIFTVKGNSIILGDLKKITVEITEKSYSVDSQNNLNMFLYWLL